MRKYLLAGALAGAFSLPAAAGSLTYDNYTFSGINSIHITSPNNITGGAGPITLYEKGVVVVADAWCMDVDSFLAGGATVGALPFTLTNADSNLPGVPNTLTQDQLNVISWLVYNGDHTTDATLQGAFQVAIWKEEYGSAFTYQSFDAVFDVDVGHDISIASFEANADAKGAPLALTFLVPGQGVSSQTLVFGSPIPEPSTWAMMLAGFGLVGALSWRKRTARYAV